MKNDASLLFKKLKKLNAVHRVLLTGTPLNNNLRELFNLLNFLDEPNFQDLKDLEARFVDLNENLVIELHEMLKPYILRRVKADVLKLPPKIEIIVPISMTAPQRLLYKRILFKHREAINAILKQRRTNKPKKVEAPMPDQAQASTSAIIVADKVVAVDAPQASTSADGIELPGPASDVEMADASGKDATVEHDQDTTDADATAANRSTNATANGAAETNGNASGESSDGSASAKPHSNGMSNGSARHLTPPMDLD